MKNYLDNGLLSGRMMSGPETRMNSAAVNLLIAILLLAANAFYVAAEFALVKSRGFRVKAMAEQNRFGARLLQQMMGNIEAYLACCQLGITMASLGLSWVGELTVAALLKPVLEPLGMPESALHFTAFITGFWCSPRCIS
jgi:CBS domain containing-hemolysin-like protein